MPIEPELFKTLVWSKLIALLSGYIVLPNQEETEFLPSATFAFAWTHKGSGTFAQALEFIVWR